jgi:hypothetical protein
MADYNQSLKVILEGLLMSKLMRCAAVLAFIVSTLDGQVNTSAAIRGLVTDSSGAVVSGAGVTIRNSGTGEERTTQTDGSGYYSLPSIVPGTYSLTITHAGFKRAEVTNRVAGAAQVAQVDVVLEVGQTSQSVTVSAAGAELIDTSSAAVSGTIVTKLVNNLPVNGRNFFDLAITLPNVSLQSLGPSVSMGSSSQNFVFGTSPASPIFRSSGIFAAGNRDSAVNVTFDGINDQSSNYGTTNPQQPPSSIEEIKIQVSGMNAEFGYGVASVNVITKSGTNKFHGEAYEFLQNDKLDANGFFPNLAGRARAPYRQNQFGAAVGGPVLPNKLFFFGAYEGLRVRQSTFSIEPVPPVNLRSGNFAGSPAIYNPFSYNPATGLRNPFAGNQIPLTTMDPVTYKFLQNWVPTPNALINGVPDLVGNTSQKLDSDQGILRVDYIKSEKTRIYGRYSQLVSPSIGTGLQSLEGTVQDDHDSAVGLHWTQIISPTTINDLSLGFARPNWFYGRNESVPDVSSLIGLANTSPLPGGPSFTGTPYTLNPSGTFVLIATDNIYQLGDDLTKIVGRHNLKLGFQAIERRFYFPIQAQDKGSFAFSPAYTAPCPAGNSTCRSALGASGLQNSAGDAFASYLLGTAISGLYQANQALYGGHRAYYGAYVQDSWRFNNRLTINYGLRYDYWGPWFNPRHTTSYFNPTNGDLRFVLQNPDDYLSKSTDYGRNAPLTPGIPKAGYTTPKLNFSPRVGLAYSVTPTTVFRAGFGSYYNGNINMNQFSDIQTNVSPFRLRYQTIASSGDQLPSILVNGNYAPISATAIPQPFSNPPATFRFQEPYMPNEEVLEWEASIQQRLGSQWATEVDYQGTHAYHLNQFVDVNSPILPQGAAANLSLQQRRPLPQWGVLGTWAPIGYGRYNALSATVKNNDWRGLTYLSSFTWAKNIVSAYAGNSDIGNQAIQAPYIWAGPAQFTPRLRFVNSLSYDLPFGRGKSLASGASGLFNALVGGWRVSGIIDTTTGQPTLVSVPDNSGTGYGTMPNRVCDGNSVPGGRNRLEWFNTGCFVQTPFGVWGNSPLGVIEQPGIANVNLAILKDFRLPVETSSLSLRADLYNAFNHTQWGPANNSNTPGNANYGVILSTRPPRQIQLSLALRF